MKDPSEADETPTLEPSAPSGRPEDFYESGPFRTPESLLAYLWGHREGFRRGLGVLLRMPAEQLSELSELTHRGFDIDASHASRFGLNDEDFEEVRKVLKTLYLFGQAMGSPDEALGLLRGTIVTAPSVEVEVSELDARTAELEPFFTPRVDEEHARARFSAQRALVTALETISWSVDLRGVQLENGEKVFAPVPVLRFVFDEPLGGHTAVAFQMPDEAREQLREALDGIAEEIDALRHRLGESVL